MKGFIFYRLLTILVNIGCTILGMSLVVVLALVFANPGMGLSFFIALGVVLYAWHANRFLLKVLIRNEATTKKHKDWLQVNAIVALIFALLCISEAVVIMQNPKMLVDAFKEMPYQYSPKMFTNMAIGILSFGVILLAHITWTYVLIRRYKDYFIDEQF